MELHLKDRYGNVVGTALFDARDESLVLPHRWWLMRVKRKNAICGYYPLTRIHGRSVLMSRLIMGEPIGLMVDHRDGNGLNNQRDNLRVATRAENARNRVATKKSKTGEKCIYREGKLFRLLIVTHPYRTRKESGYKKPYSKYFKSLPEAVAHRDEVLPALHGSFARSR